MFPSFSLRHMYTTTLLESHEATNGSRKADGGRSLVGGAIWRRFPLLLTLSFWVWFGLFLVFKLCFLANGVSWMRPYWVTAYWCTYTERAARPPEAGGPEHVRITMIPQVSFFWGGHGEEGETLPS